MTFKQSNKSAFALATESNFSKFNNKIKNSDIINFLRKKIELLDIWKEWSNDKRTSEGFYYKEKMIGYFSSEEKSKRFEKEFTTDIEACSEFILQEVRNILNIQDS